MDITTPQRYACFNAKCLLCGTNSDSVYIAELFDELPALTRENTFRPERNEYVYQFEPCRCRFVPGRFIEVTLHFDHNPDDVPDSVRAEYYGTPNTPVTLVEAHLNRLAPPEALPGVRLPRLPDDRPDSGAECYAPERNRR